LDLGGECPVVRDIDGSVLDDGLRWNRAEIVPVFPVTDGSDRSRRETSSAIWTDVSDHLIDARRAKGAFERADARIQRVRRQSFVAVFARGSERQRRQHIAFIGRNVVLAADLFFGTGHGQMSVEDGRVDMSAGVESLATVKLKRPRSTSSQLSEFSRRLPLLKCQDESWIVSHQDVEVLLDFLPFAHFTIAWDDCGYAAAGMPAGGALARTRQRFVTIRNW
jgi:hypothetical protein